MKLHQRVFQILIVALGTQLAFHFWPDWATVFGIRVDYLAPKIYLTDLVLLVLIASWLVEIKPKLGKLRKIRINKKHLIISGTLLFVVLNTIYSVSWQIALLSWLKLLEVTCLVIYVYANWVNIKEKIQVPLAVSLLVIFFVALAQFISQHTIGLWIIGERSFSATTPGVALINIFGKKLLRPYSIFSHPNQMAGFALISLPFTLPLMAGILAVAILVLSFSRGAWLAAFLVITAGIATIKNEKATSFIPVLICFLSLVLMPTSSFLLSRLSFNQSLQDRLILAVEAGRLFSQRPILGVGLGNFIPAMSSLSGFSRILQPVHNIFLLVLVEAGIVGLILFYFLVSICLFKTLVRNDKSYLVSVLLMILFTGMVDHYWLTLQQTQLLFGIVIGASLSKNENEN